MYFAHVGRQFLTHYNTRFRASERPLGPREFVDEVLAPTLFGPGGNLLHVSNSPFDQAYKQHSLWLKTCSREEPLGREYTDVRRAEVLNEFHAKVEELAVLGEPHMHLYMGGVARELAATTSGQVSETPVPVSADAIYCSWIGYALPAGVAGGATILFTNPDLLALIFEGWDQYRRYREETPNLKPHQLHTWNALWLAHRLSRRYDPSNPLRGIDTRLNEDEDSLGTLLWTRLVFALRRAPSVTRETIYVSQGGQMNTTIGFIPLRVAEIGSLFDLYATLFEIPEGFDGLGAIEEIYDPSLSFQMACRTGSIGIAQMKTADARRLLDEQKPPRRPKDPASLAKQQLTLTWIVAMLNDSELYALAESFAKSLVGYEAGASRGKTTRGRAVDTLLNSQGKTQFTTNLEPLFAEDAAVRGSASPIVPRVLSMPADQLRLFLSLVRLQRIQHTTS